jgi:hypothetical protein
LERIFFIEVEYIIIELVDLAWGKATHLDLDLNQEPLDEIDVDEEPRPIVKFCNSLITS